MTDVSQRDRRIVAPPKAPRSQLRKTPKRPGLYVKQILEWADRHFARHHRWPNVKSGYIAGTIDETWQRMDMALRVGCRGLPRNAGLSLARLLEKHRRVRNLRCPPRLTVSQIIAWARAHHRRTGEWPIAESSHVRDATEETWNAIDAALRRGGRGLPGGSSLPQLLARKCGVRNLSSLPRLSYNKILKWCDAHQRRTGKWPTNQSGPIDDAPGETWSGVNAAVRNGIRGLAGGSSLAVLLAHKRGRRTRSALPKLSNAKILGWCDAHQRRTGKWPTRDSGPITDAPGETWLGVDAALRNGCRGLAGGVSLAAFLARHRQVLNRTCLPQLSFEGILQWADSYFGRHGRWPNVNSGRIEETLDDTWSRMDNVLRDGSRGLPRNSGLTLARLLEQRRGVRNSEYPPKLTITQILRWAKAHHRRTGRWPTAKSGPILEAPQETWLAIDMALRRGHRGLRGRSSLARVLRNRGLW